MFSSHKVKTSLIQFVYVGRAADFQINSISSLARRILNTVKSFITGVISSNVGLIPNKAVKILEAVFPLFTLNIVRKFSSIQSVHGGTAYSEPDVELNIA